MAHNRPRNGLFLKYKQRAASHLLNFVTSFVFFLDIVCPFNTYTQIGKAIGQRTESVGALVQRGRA